MTDVFVLRYIMQVNSDRLQANKTIFNPKIRSYYIEIVNFYCDLNRIDLFLSLI